MMMIPSSNDNDNNNNNNNNDNNSSKLTTYNSTNKNNVRARAATQMSEDCSPAKDHAKLNSTDSIPAAWPTCLPWPPGLPGLPDCLPACLPACLAGCLPAWLPACLPWQPDCLPCCADSQVIAGDVGGTSRICCSSAWRRSALLPCLQGACLPSFQLRPAACPLPRDALPSKNPLLCSSKDQIQIHRYIYIYIYRERERGV